MEKIWIKKVQGLDCEENYFLGAYLQETRDLDTIMHKIMQANM
jgi:hypothetical protein